MKIVNVEYFKDTQWLAKEALFMLDRKNSKVIAQILWNDAMELLKKAYGYESDKR
ncbi:hypothetical protein NV034_003761 [Salmonella enterica subsp. enterica serovar Kentucky]|nr:hypothetical protein [Salmonella enterica subsp. enterica serovar Kentucky]EJT0791039.1 hypothetical protein [Salmonella enterica subsp. enterica serovar Kentucky]EME1300561.1 hypothetical protein [Salmonella enterica subsp. enterica serovar Kentucky]